jgi:spoIIIJ-associated protein
MSEIEVQAEGVEAALELAAQQLGVPESDIGYEVVDSGAKGMLGIGAREVTLRAWVLGDQQSSGDSATEPAGEPVGVAAGTETAEQETDAPMSDEESADLVEIVLDAVDEILDGFDVDADSEAYIDPEGSVMVELTGPDLGGLIGRRGLTLEAMQYLLGRVASRATGRRVRVIADAEGYRARRREALTELAFRTARRVTQSRQSIALRPMPASERRVIHVALADEAHVITESEGEDPNRKIVISPR